MSQPFLTTVTAESPEQVTVQITGTIKDHTDTAIPLASLGAVTLTLYDKRTQTILNSRSEGSIKNANGGTITSGGALTLVLDPDDNVMASAGAGVETHVAQISWTYNSGTATGRALVEFPIRNLAKVT